MSSRADNRTQQLPTERFLVFMWHMNRWELQGVAETVEERDNLVKHADSIPKGGQVVWRRFVAEGVAQDRFGHVLDPSKPPGWGNPDVRSDGGFGPLK